jgi:hypothetical protein
LPSTRIDRAAGDDDADADADADAEELEVAEAEVEELPAEVTVWAALPAVVDAKDEEELPPQADRPPAVSNTEIHAQSRNVIIDSSIR